MERKKFKVTFLVKHHLTVEMPNVSGVKTWTNRILERKASQGEDWTLKSIEELPDEEE